MKLENWITQLIKYKKNCQCFFCQSIDVLLLYIETIVTDKESNTNTKDLKLEINQTMHNSTPWVEPNFLRMITAYTLILKVNAI